MSNFQKPPLVMAGLVLGLFALGNLLGGYSLVWRLLLGSLALVFYILLIVGMLRHGAFVKDQLRQALVTSVFPTFFMSGMIFSGYLLQLLGWQMAALMIWWLSFLGNCGLILYFTWRFTLRFSWDVVYPSWSVLYVGFAVSGLTAGVSGQFLIGQIVFWLGLILTICVLPLMSIRAYKIGLPEAAKPNISTFCAPMSLLLASYLTTFPNPQVGIVWGLLFISQLLYFFVVVQLPILLKRPFNPGFSAFTFPFVISATSFSLAANYLELDGWVQILITLEIALATVLVLFVTWHYFIYLTKREWDKNR